MKNGKTTFKEKVEFFFKFTLRRNWGMRILALICGVIVVLLIGYAGII